MDSFIPHRPRAEHYFHSSLRLSLSLIFSLSLILTLRFIFTLRFNLSLTQIKLTVHENVLASLKANQLTKV